MQRGREGDSSLLILAALNEQNSERRGGAVV